MRHTVRTARTATEPGTGEPGTTEPRTVHARRARLPAIRR